MISVVMAVGPQRKEQLYKTLHSIHALNQGTEYEIICVLDRQKSSDFSPFPNVSYHEFSRAREGWANPATVHNFGFTRASGKYLVIQNPENLHLAEDNLARAVEHIEADPLVSVFGACEARKQDGTFDQWYCHSEHKRVPWFFFQAILKEHIDAIGGFSEKFTEYGGEDQDFAARLENIKVRFVWDDSILVAHQWHPSTGTGAL